jgi:uncharacterized protein (DUF433 family)
MPHRMRSEIIKDPSVMGGLPVIKGTRVPAHLIGSIIGQGASELEVLRTYPWLTLDDVRLAVRYAEDHPEEDY